MVGTEVKLDGEELLIMKESDIMGVLTDMPIAKKARKRLSPNISRNTSWLVRS